MHWAQTHDKLRRWAPPEHWLVCVLPILFCFGAGCERETISAPRGDRQLERPNILLLVAEDMSPRVGSFGDPVAQTPRLDALAAEGSRFPHTFSTAGVCAPSRAAQITGVHQNTLGAGHMRTSTYPKGAYAAVPPPWIKAYPEILRAAGFYTFNWGKTDYQLSDSSLGSGGPRTIWDESGALGAVDWRAAPVDRPFFGMINFGVTHESGLFPLSGWPDSFTHGLIMLARLAGGPASEAVTDPADVELPPFYRDTPVSRAAVARQYDNIHRMDQQVGEILDALENDGLADATIVIWTTDHGSGLPGAKRELTDAGIQVPMIIRWPERFRPQGMPPGSIEERLVSFVDLAPTILAMAGAEIPDWMVGQVVVGPQAAAPREFVFAARDRLDKFPDRSRAVRSKRFKYIRNWRPDLPAGFDLGFRRNIPLMKQWRYQFEQGMLNDVQSKFFRPRGPEELYDLANDPWETQNLAMDPAFAETREEMRGVLERWLASSDDQGAVPEETLVAKFEPLGKQSATPGPSITIRKTTSGWEATVSHADPQTSLGYRRSGQADPDHWELYHQPVPLEGGEQITAFAVRYGWSESDWVEATAGSSRP